MAMIGADSGERGQALRNIRRVVLKVGTRLLTGVDGVSKGERVSQLVARIATLRDQGMEVILVSSGAIGAGMMVLGTERRPTSVPKLQAHAAVGQSRLMYLYETACRNHRFHCAQMLLTAADVQDRERHLNVVSCLDALLASGVLPIINENDSVSVDEIRFGDNDMLAALVAMMAKADLTVLLTTVDGLHERQGNVLGKRISVVPRITPEILAMGGDTLDSQFSVGGMVTKLKAAETVTRAGEHLAIADGRDFGIIDRIFAGEDVGTLFTPVKERRMRGHQRFLAFFSEFSGDIVVDPGAEQALTQAGKSLLPSGISAVNGTFERGDTVRILNARNTEIARGVSNYSAAELEQIKGHQTVDIARILGAEAYEEVVHRNNMALLKT